MLELMLHRIGEMVNRMPPARYVHALFTLLAHQGVSATWDAIRRKIHVLKLAVVSPGDREMLASILERHADKPAVICPPLLNWHVPLFQRPQHLAAALSRRGFLYFYCTDNCLFDNVRGFEPLAENLYLSNRYSLLLKQPGKKIIHLYSTDYRTTADWIIQQISLGNIIIYEYIDEIHEKIAGRHIPESVFKKHRTILKDERCIVIATADKLYREVLQSRSGNCALATNGVDLQHFAKFRDREHVPDKLSSAIDSGRPVIGYMGAFASWFDYGLILKIAMARPQHHIVLIGWDYDKTMSRHRLTDLPNVHYLGPVPYQRLPEYTCWFDVAIIPFLLNDITESTSPIKLFEYMAMGHPIVTTGMPECRKYRSVLVGEDHADFIAKVDRALELRDDAAYRQSLHEEALENTWDAKAEVIADLIRKNL